VTSLAFKENLAVSSPAPTLDAFFEHVRYSNPFSSNRVVPSTAVKEDADQVHRTPFNRLTDLAHQSLKQQSAIGALLWGEAGVGKSHVLGRLANWAGVDDKHAIFLYLANLQAQPEQMPRSLLRCIASILTRGRTADFSRTTLFRLVRAAVRHALQDEGGQHTWASAEAAYLRLIDELCAAAPARAALVDRATYVVLFRFFRSVYITRDGYFDGVAALAVRWLAGDPLEPEEARALGLASAGQNEETVAVADDEQIKRILIALARFAAFWDRPFILCFDQVDNLEREQFSALSRFLQALLDGAANLLVITAGVQSTLFGWEADGTFTESARDRIAHHKINLQRVTVPEARQIVQSRLQPFQEPFLSLPAVKNLVQRDYLFPLGESWARARFADLMDVRPRDVINWAADEWRRQQEVLQQLGGAAWLENWSTTSPPPPSVPPPSIDRLVDDKVAAKLCEHVRQRQLEPQTLPPDADNLAGLIHSLLKHCLNASEFGGLLAVERLSRPKYGPRPAFDLKLRHRNPSGEGETVSGLLCLVVGNRTSMTGYLRRLLQDEKPPQQVFLVTEERRTLDPAAAGNRYLEQVRNRHGERFRHVDLTFDQYAELDALQAVIGLARSGDLEVELAGGNARRVSEAEVIESYRRKGQLLTHPLLRQLISGSQVRPVLESASLQPTPEAAQDGNNDSQDLREFIMGRLGMTMGCSTKELAVQYREYLLQVKQQHALGEGECRRRVEEEALQLHQERKLNATPHDDYLFLLNR
jgi:hypothetical protein